MNIGRPFHPPFTYVPIGWACIYKTTGLPPLNQDFDDVLGPLVEMDIYQKIPRDLTILNPKIIDSLSCFPGMSMRRVLIRHRLLWAGFRSWVLILRPGLDL